METTHTAVRNGTPWVMIALVALIIAKLGFGVNIGWWWVFAPFWLPIVIVLGIFALIAAVIAVVFVVALLWDALTNRRRYA